MSKCQKDVKLSKRKSNCQKDVKLTNVKKVKSLDYEGGSQKIINWHNKVYRYWCQKDVKYEGHQNCPKILSMHTLRVFGYHHMWYQNWCQYVWTSLCQFIFCELSIVQVFDFLTIDIFLTTWHHLIFCCQITYVPHYSWEQGWWGIWAMWHVPLLDLHGGTVMGYMSNRVHGQWST